jgi:hypothetical protein
MASDEEVGRQILRIFMEHKVGASGVLRRNHFIDVRDADFQRGLNKAVENRWIKIKSRDRYTYNSPKLVLQRDWALGFRRSL